MAFRNLTNSGKEYLATRLANELPVKFIKAKIGNGSVPLLTNPADTKELYNFKKEVTILDAIQEQNSIKLTLQITNDGINEGFYLKEIGIYADDNGKEVLYWYCNEDNAQYINSQTDIPIIFEIDIMMEVTNINSTVVEWSGKGTWISKTYFDEKVRTYEIPTIADLQSRKNLKVGDIVEVLGYYTAGDGAGHKRIIANEDDGSGIQLKNRLWANVVHNGEVNVSWFGAKGDGVTDDTQAIQKALNTGNTIIGEKTYKVGEQNKAYDVLTINKSITVKLSLIDNRTFSSYLHANRKHGTFLVNASNVNIDCYIRSENKLPVDADEANNLSDVGGYAINVGDKVENLDIKLRVENINGIKAVNKFYNSKIDILAKTSAYPYACEIAINSNIDINVDECHRAFWGACENCRINIFSKNFISTGNSAHVLFCSIKDTENKLYHFKNSYATVIDTGTTSYNSGAAYIGFNNQYSDLISEITGTINIYGDISNSDNNIFWLMGEVGTQNASEIKGNITINNYLKAGRESIQRWYNGADLHFNSFSNIGNLVINTKSDINLNVIGNNIFEGIVKIDNIGNRSNIYIEKVSSFSKEKETNYTPDHYSRCILKDILEFDPKSFYRHTLHVTKRFLGGQEVSLQELNTPYMATKMQQEGVYNDFIVYMDEKTAYDKQRRKLEQDRQLAYEEALQDNPNLSYEEFMSIQPTTLNLVEEPQPSEKLKQFMEKYL